MRTWLVLGAVLAVTLAAVADALHGGRATVSKAKPVEQTSGSRIVPPGAPSGFMGTVYYSDSQDGCRVKTLAIPGFESTKPPDSRSCRFSLSPDGESVVPGHAVWKPQGGLVAIPGASDFELASPGSSQTIRIGGQTPAFKPNGTLTYIRDGELLEWSIHCPNRERLFTLPGDNATARCTHVLSTLSARSIKWLTNTRFVAVLGGDQIAIVDHGRTVARRAFVPARRARLELSPRRTFFTLWLDGNLFGAFDRKGDQITMPPIRGIRSLAWSPSERWAMLATGRGSVYLFRPDTGDLRLRRLDISARDLAWR
jgi:hypothetical protein